MIVGIARGILVVISQGNILDTIIHACVKFLEQLSLHVSAIGMLFFQNLLNFIVPSGSGQASVSMPFIIPIADLIDMNRQIAVLIFQFGDGFEDQLLINRFDHRGLLQCLRKNIHLSINPRLHENARPGSSG